MKRLFFAITLVLTSGVLLVAFKPAHQFSTNPIAPGKPAAAARLATKWAIDKAHSSVKFAVTHMVVSEVEGSFKAFDGSIENTKADFSDAKINFTVDVNSVSTDNENRDKHLKSADFFDVEKYTQMKFESTAFKPLGGNKYKLEGNLTIKDVTKAVSFDVTLGGPINTARGAVAGFKATTVINRFDYNLKWDRATEAGGLVVSKEVTVTVNTEFKEVK